MSSLVSIIVPVYNVGPYLSRCIDSLLAQDYQYVEVILVDDGSPDACPAICDDYASKYSYIRVIHQENRGLSEARLSGFKQASGEYILFIDSDDYVLPGMVSTLVHALEEQKADLAICAYFTQTGQKTTPNLLPYTEFFIAQEDITEQYILPLFGNSFQGINIPGFLGIRLMKKSLIQEDFFVPENIYFMEDHVFDLEYAKHISRIAIVNQPLYAYCVNRDSLSTRYRPNKWQMYVNIYGYFQNYLLQNDIPEPSERLAYMLAGGIFASIDNAVLCSTYDAFRQEIASIQDFDPAKQLLSNILILNIPFSYIVSFTLFRTKLFRILYIFRQSILNKYA